LVSLKTTVLAYYADPGLDAHRSLSDEEYPVVFAGFRRNTVASERQGCATYRWNL